MYHSTLSDDYLWQRTLPGKQKKIKTHPNTKILPIFNGRNKNGSEFSIFGKKIFNFEAFIYTN